MYVCVFVLTYESIGCAPMTMAAASVLSPSEGTIGGQWMCVSAYVCINVVCTTYVWHGDSELLEFV
jgi:hypothetical protein